MNGTDTRDTAHLYGDVNRWLQFSYEFVWLFVLLVVPLVFSGKNHYFNFTQPKQHIIHFAAIAMVVLATFEFLWSARQGVMRWGWDYFGRLIKGYVADLKTNPYRWGVVFLMMMIGAHLLAWAVSPSSFVSFTGRDANDPGNDVYTIVSIMIISLTVAVKMRSIKQVERVVIVLAVVGVITAIYGMSQYLGTAAANLCEGAGDWLGCGAGLDRVYATFGNPIFFSSYLLFSSIATMCLMWLYSVRGYGRYAIPIGTVLLAFQLIMSYATTSRGPILGVFVALAAGLLVLSILKTGRGGVIRGLLAASFVPLIWIVTWLVDYTIPSWTVFIAGPVLSAVVLGLAYREYRQGLGLKTTIFFALLTLGLLWYVLTWFNVFGFLYDVTNAVLLYAALVMMMTFRDKFRFYGALAMFMGAFCIQGFAFMIHGIFALPGDLTPFNALGGWLMILILPLTAVLYLAAGRYLPVVKDIEKQTKLWVLALAIGGAMFALGVSEVSGLTDKFGGDAWRVTFDRVVTETAAPDETTVETFNEISSGRINIWLAGLDLARDRVIPDDFATTPIAFRHLFGYGNEMYYLSYPLTIRPRSEFRISSNAHNVFLHTFLEQGAFGLIAFLGILGSATASLLLFLRKRGGSGGIGYAVPLALAVMIGALLVGRYAEQFFGLARVSDNLTGWLMLGVSIAMGSAAIVNRDPVKPDRADDARSLRDGASKAVRHDRSSLARIFAIPVAGTAVVLALGLALFVGRDGQDITASRSAVESITTADTDFTEGDVSTFLDGLEPARQAILQNPQSELYLTQYFQRLQTVLTSAVNQRQYDPSIQILDRLDGAWEATEVIKSGSYNQILVAMNAQVNRLSLLRSAEADLVLANNMIQASQESPEQLATLESRKATLETHIASLKKYGEVGELEMLIRERLVYLETYLKAYPTVMNTIGSTYLQLNDWEKAQAAAQKGIELSAALRIDPLESYEIVLNATYFNRRYNDFLDAFDEVVTLGRRYDTTNIYREQIIQLLACTSRDTFGIREYEMAERANQILANLKLTTGSRMRCLQL